MAFASSVTLHRRTASNRRNVCNRPNRIVRTPRMELSLGTIILDVGALGVVAGAVVYWDKLPKEFTDRFKSKTDSNTDKSSESSTDSEPAFAKNDEGVLGLMGDSRSEPRAASFSVPERPKPVMQPEPLPDAERRAKEEISWALGVLNDLGTVTVVILDGKQDTVHAEGALYVKDQPVGSFVGRAEESIHENSTSFPFIADTARSVGCWSLADSGGALIVASDEPYFFSARELRIIKAVSTRLGAFISKIPAKLEGVPE